MNANVDYEKERTKSDVLFEYYGVKTYDEAHAIYWNELNYWREAKPLPSWYLTKLELPYEASSHPGIPTISEIDQAMKGDRLSHPYAQQAVCRIRATVVKCGDQQIIHVLSSMVPRLSKSPRFMLLTKSRKPRVSYISRNTLRSVYQSCMPSLLGPKVNTTL
jgi:hypothetical protein